MFKKMDTNQDGLLSLAELQAGFASEFGDLSPAAKDAIPTLFEQRAKADDKGEKALKIGVFNRFYAQILFTHFDANGDGVLQLEEAQAALKWLTKPSADGNVAVAFPPDAYTESGELALPFGWFWGVYSAME